ncbi:MAG TPA: class I SAM-dependent methyltransferase [Candidatus Pacearchaeota archaeon]|nr:class I SAM-dependent methyltransferase [Candidatus Pacearchaeota archaeon]
MISPYLLIRKWLQSSPSKESLNKRTTLLSKIFQYKFEPLEKMAEQGVRDVTVRLDFLLKESSGKVLDVGCYNGFYSFELAKKGCDVIGIDMLEMAVDYANGLVNVETNIKFVKGYAENLPFSDGEFDTTIISHTLEHVFDHERSLSEAVRVTKNKGKLIAIVPREMGNAPAHLRHVSSEVLNSMMREYCHVGKELAIGKGIGYVGNVK